MMSLRFIRLAKNTFRISVPVFFKKLTVAHTFEHTVVLNTHNYFNQIVLKLTVIARRKTRTFVNRSCTANLLIQTHFLQLLLRHFECFKLVNLRFNFSNNLQVLQPEHEGTPLKIFSKLYNK